MMTTIFLSLFSWYVEGALNKFVVFSSISFNVVQYCLNMLDPGFTIGHALVILSIFAGLVSSLEECFCHCYLGMS